MINQTCYRLATATLLATLLLQCAGAGNQQAPRTSSIPQSGVTPVAPQVEISEINRLLALAADAQSPLAEQLTIQAAELALEDDDIDTASAILGSLGLDSNWPMTVRTRSALLRAELAIHSGEFDRALILLNGPPFERVNELNNEVRQRLMTLRARAFLGMNQFLAAAREHTRMAALLRPEQQEQNIDQIWQILASAPPGNLQAQSGLIDSYELRGWIELVNLINSSSNNVEQQVRAIAAWQSRWTQHSAAKSLPRALSFTVDVLNTRAERIALMLPLSEAAGKAVSEGFLAAYYEARSQSQQVPEIQIYDTSGITDIMPLYNQIADSGFDLIVGPLRKDSVRQLQSQTTLRVPTLALNYGDEGVPTPPNLYQFGLAPEDEIRQTVKMARQAGHTVAVIMTPSGNEYARIRDTFTSEWEKLGGNVVAAVGFGGSGSYSDNIRQMLDVDDSEARAIQLRSVIPRSNLVFTPRRRQDVDVLFLLANPAEGRQIRPTMGFHFAGDVAIYAMPAIYDGLTYDGGTSTNVNRDLNGITFIDAPWILTSDDPLKSSTAQAFAAGAGPVERLRAMGVDSYRLHNRLAQLANFPGVNIQGATGKLSMRNDGSIQRELLPAQFVEGSIVLPSTASGSSSIDSP
ncbi:MAG: penicillin-binding protein activator [Pseudohongiella sp.]|nr:penicillin-binding protein activator [Pseudohongiella sp.]